MSSKYFRVTLEWSMSGDMVVLARSKAEAKRKATLLSAHNRDELENIPECVVNPHVTDVFEEPDALNADKAADNEISYRELVEEVGEV